MEDFRFEMPKEIEVGFSKSEELATYIQKQDLENILLVVDYNLNRMGLIDGIIDNLDNNDINFTIFDEIKNEPTVVEIDKAIAELNVPANFDGVVGIGGGSTMDLAKLLGVSGSIEGSVKEYVNQKQISSPGVYTIMLPTTSGTGSEVTPNAIIKNEKEELKQGVVSPYLIPNLVILDPGLTITLPSKITAETGIDAFTHAIECFTCNKATPMSDMFAYKSMELISNNLRQAVNNGEDREARYNMALGSLYGGVAITNSGTGGVHALAYPLGGKYGISHGLSNSILLPEVMNYNAEAIPGRFVEVAEAMGIETDGISEDKIVGAVVNEIKSLVEDTGIELEELEITEEIIEDLSQSAMNVQRLLSNNPRKIDKEAARKIYVKSLM